MELIQTTRYDLIVALFLSAYTSHGDSNLEIKYFFPTDLYFHLFGKFHSLIKSFICLFIYSLNIYLSYFFLLLVGIRAGKIAEVNYNQAKTIERGRAVMKEKKKFFRKKVTEEEGEEGEEEVEDEGDHIDDEEGKHYAVLF